MAQAEKKEQLYEGKAKKVFATNDPALCIVSYKDDATAFDGLKTECPTTLWKSSKKKREFPLIS